MFSHSPLDWGLIAAYFAFLAAVWWRGWGRGANTLDYLVAGRRVTLPAFVATLVATWYGGILGVGEYSWRFGVSNWLVFGVPYYVGALLFAVLLAKRARAAELYTIPDLLDRRYGRAPALFGAVAVFITSAPAAYVLVLGTLFSAMTGWALAPCIVAAAVLSMFYIDKGGLRTVVFTDKVQFVLMYLGFALMLAFLIGRYGALPFTPHAVPATHFTWHGGNPPQAILVWYFIALSALVDPGFWQRAYAARDPKVARDGVLWSIACWAVFDLMTTACGLYARALLPRLADPVYAFPELARVALPPVALGVFYLGMIATVMSTIDSYGFIAATTIGRDFVWRLKRDADEARIPFYSRLGLVISTGFATALALMNHSVIALWHDIGSVITPTLLVPVGAALLGIGALGSGWALATMMVPFAVTLFWLLVKIYGTTHSYPLSIEPIYPGLLSSLVVFAAGWIARKRGVRSVNVARVPLAVIAALSLVVAAREAVAAEASPDTGTSASPATSDTLARIVTLPEVVVNTTRSGEHAPIARSVMTRETLREKNWGQDTPMVLASQPSAYAYSDAGNGIGYSYLSIRGFPQRRISVLVNGVPLNDPESHEVYWIDHPDLLASTTEAEVQRGVGSALYGAASLGGSVNLETAPFSETPATVASLAYGSYDTKRLMLESNSGRLAGGWNLYGRYSRIETLGYRDDSWSKLWSYALSARRITRTQSFRVNLYGGPEETHLAYLGVPRDVLDGGLTGDALRDRRFNPITYPNERDHYFEPHYELIHSWSPRPELAFSQTLFWYDGKGYYDEQRFGVNLADYRLTPWFTADTLAYPADYFARDTSGAPVYDADGRKLLERFDVVRRRTVENRHYGWVPRLRIEHAGSTLTIGGELRAHDGRHYGNVISGDGLPPGSGPDHAYYDYHPRTLSGSMFAREEWTVTHQVLITGDLAWRHQSYAMRGDQFDGVSFDQTYDFVTPRIGAAWTPRASFTAFASWAHSSREPAFRDLYDAEGAGSVPLYAVRDPATGTYSDPLIHPETVNDFELGASWRGPAASATVNLFRMDFRDELVYAGQFNTDLGYPILGNAARSLHQGVELAVHSEHGLAHDAALSLDANATLADNHFISYRESYGPTAADDVSYDGNAIGFFPAALGNLSAQVAWSGVRLGADARYAGRIYLDNTEAQASSIAPHTVIGAVAGFGWRLAGTHADVSLRVLNVFDDKYESGGYMDYDSRGTLTPHFVPAATRNVLAQMRVEF